MTREELINNRSCKVTDAALDYLKSDPYTAFKAGVDWADNNPNWISVEDELPPIEWVYSDLVLVTDGERYHLGLYNHDSGDWFDVDFVPTHWMPLPNLPKK